MCRGLKHYVDINVSTQCCLQCWRIGFSSSVLNKEWALSPPSLAEWLRASNSSSGANSQECGFESRSWHLCPWARYFTIIASLHPGEKMGTCEGRGWNLNEKAFGAIWTVAQIVYSQGSWETLKKGCYWPYDQGINVKRIATVIVKCAIYKNWLFDACYSVVNPPVPCTNLFHSPVLQKPTQSRSCVISHDSRSYPNSQ